MYSVTVHHWDWTMTFLDHLHMFYRPCIPPMNQELCFIIWRILEGITFSTFRKWLLLAAALVSFHQTYFIDQIFITSTSCLRQHDSADLHMKLLPINTHVVNKLQSSVITCVFSSGSNRSEPMGWDKQPFYNEGWSRSAIQQHSSC